MSALIYCPFPDCESARALAAQLLDERLIACANILGEVESLFEWDGKRGTAQEVAVMFKTHADRLDEAVLRMSQLHPYEAPAVLGWRCDTAAPETARWLSGIV